MQEISLAETSQLSGQIGDISIEIDIVMKYHLS